MSSRFATLSIPVRVALGTIAWALVLLFAWAIQPVDAVAPYAPVADPTPSEQVSIDRVLAETDDPERDLVEQFECTSTPLQAATGTASPLAIPALDDGFQYVGIPCSSPYKSARAAVWVNVAAIATVLAGCVALHLHQRRRSTAADTTDEAASADELVDH